MRTRKLYHQIKPSLFFKLTKSNRAIIPYIILSISLCLVLIYSYQLYLSVKSEDQSQFNNFTRDVKMDIEYRVVNYTQSLEGLGGLFAASETVNQDEFYAYIDRLDWQQNYPGIKGIGYGIYVRSADDILSAKQVAKGLNSNKIWPEDVDNQFHSIIYTENQHGLQDRVFNDDIFKNPSQINAIKQACSTGLASISDRIRLTNNSSSSEIIIYIPIFRKYSLNHTSNNKSSQLIGYIYSLVNVEKLIEGIFSNDERGPISFQIFNYVKPQPNKLIYQSVPNNIWYHNTQFVENCSINFVNQQWLVSVKAQPSFDNQENKATIYHVLVIGMLVSLLLFSMAKRLTDTTETAEHMAIELDNSLSCLRNSEEKLVVALHAARMGTWNWNPINNEIYWSMEAEKIFSRMLNYIPKNYKEFKHFIYKEDLKRVSQVIKEAFHTNKNNNHFELAFRVLNGDNNKFWLECKGRVFKDDNNNAIQLMGTIANITERKQSQKTQEALLEASPDLIFLVNEDGKFLDYNISYKNTSYTSSNPFMGQNITDVMPPQTAQLTLQNIALALKTRQIQCFEYALNHNNQTTFWEMRIVDWGDNSALLIVRDISDKKIAEERVKSYTNQQIAISEFSRKTLLSNKLPQLLKDAAILVAEMLQVEYTALWEFDYKNDNLILKSGDGWPREIIGHATIGNDNERSIYQLLQESSPLGVNWLETNPAIIKPALLKQYNVASCISVMIHKKDRPYGRLAAYSTQERIFNNDEIRFLRVIADILSAVIERSIREQKIIEQAALLNVTKDAVLVCDLEYQILFWNKGAEKIYGWTSTEVQNRSMRELLSPSTLPSNYEEIKQEVLKKGEWAGQLLHINKDGKEIMIESRWTLVYNHAEVPTSLLIVNTDITEKKKLEDAFLRTQRMENIGALASGIAHDLNNVLSPILMSIQIFKRQFTDERNQKILSTVENATKRGVELIKQVLSFGKGLDSQQATIDVKHIISEIVAITEHTFPKSIRINKHVANDLWAIKGNTTQLHQVLMNLCVNARDAMPNGGVLLLSADNLIVDEKHLLIDSSLPLGSYIAISINDTGSGIPSEIMDKIFDPFFSTKEAGKGTGLGLSTVSNIITNHQGYIKVSSEKGKGTQFQIILPALRLQEDHLTKKYLDLPYGNGESILLVDDEKAIQEVSKASLMAYNYNVLTANNGAEGVAIYAQNRDTIKLVITDLQMPEMDGVSMIKILKNINPQVKVLVTTGMNSNIDELNLIHLGITSYLQKPYNIEQLITTLSERVN